MSQRGQQCGCGSPHIAWLSWERKAPLGKEASTQMEKSHNRLGGNSGLQNNISKSKCGDPQIKEIKRRAKASSCWPKETKPCPLAHRAKSKTRKSDKKNLPWEEFGRITNSDAPPRRIDFRECPAEIQRPQMQTRPKQWVVEGDLPILMKTYVL